VLLNLLEYFPWLLQGKIAFVFPSIFLDLPCLVAYVQNADIVEINHLLALVNTFHFKGSVAEVICVCSMLNF
jgi:hypothetical protein